MSIKEEVERFSKLSGEDGWNTEVLRIGSFLDGYDLKEKEISEKIEILKCHIYKANELLRASWDFLKKQKELTGGIKILKETSLFYDDTENNGLKLIEDIENWYKEVYGEEIKQWMC